LTYRNRPHGLGQPRPHETAKQNVLADVAPGDKSHV